MKKYIQFVGSLILLVLAFVLISCGPKHSYIKDVIEPTCTEEGYTVYLCEICGDFYEDDFKKPLGHNLIHHDSKAASCDENGYEEYDTCTRCSYTTYKNIPALNHSYGQATYSWNQELTKVTGTILCNTDDSHKITETVDVTKNILPANCKETGLITYTAQFENEVFSTQIKEEEIPALNHDLKTEAAVSPTCKEAGYEAYEYCTRCDYSTKKEIDALGHSYNLDEICSRCGDLAAWEYLTYEYDKEFQGYMITGVANSRTIINIPETYMNQPVKGIGTGAFKDQSSIIELNIPQSVVTIHKNAFENCKNLRKLIIPTSVTSIGYWILKGCSNLEELALPNVGGSHLGSYFSSTSYDNSYEVKNGYGLYHYIPISLKTVTLIGGTISDTFSGCSSIEKIVLKDVTEVERMALATTDLAFSKCSSLKELWFDSSLTLFSSSGLKNCSNLESLYYTGTVADWAKISFDGNSANNNPVQYAKNLFFVNPNNHNIERVTEIQITNPEITEISTRQFMGFKDVQKVILGSNVTKIKTGAFSDCISLQEITIPNTITSIQNGAFAGCYRIKSINLDISPSSFIDTALIKLFFGDSEYGNSYKVGPAANAGYSPIGLETITIHGDTSLSSYEFRNMTSLKKIVLTDLSIIPSYCFQNCSNLATVVLKNVTRIRRNAFENTTNLQYVFFEGTKEAWSRVSIESENSMLTESVIYFYSEEEPLEAGNYWHYVDQIPVPWE